MEGSRIICIALLYLLLSSLNMFRQRVQSMLYLGELFVCFLLFCSDGHGSCHPFLPKVMVFCSDPSVCYWVPCSAMGIVSFVLKHTVLQLVVWMRIQMPLKLCLFIDSTNKYFQISLSKFNLFNMSCIVAWFYQCHRTSWKVLIPCTYIHLMWPICCEIVIIGVNYTAAL